MTQLRRTVLITIAGSGHFEAARQLFASARHVGGFVGDLLLITPGISGEDRAVFENQGVIVWERAPLSVQPYNQWGPVFTLYVHLFDPAVRQWDSVVYLDTDCMVRASINPLLELEGFFARSYYNYVKPFSVLGQRLSSDVLFNPGVIVFSTDSINDDSLNQIAKLYHDLERELPSGSYDGLLMEVVLGVFASAFRKELPAAYNVIPNQYESYLGYADHEIHGVVVHHAAGARYEKPQVPGSAFFDDYHANLSLFGKPVATNSTPWPPGDIDRFEKKVMARRRRSHRYAKRDHWYGFLGQGIYSFSPKLYRVCKTVWNVIRKKHLSL